MRNILLVILMSVIILAILNILGMVELCCEILGSLVGLYIVVVGLTVTISIGLYNHIDTIIKDIPENLKFENNHFYIKTIDSLTLLKKEILFNIPVSILVFVIYYFVRNSDVFVCSINNLFANVSLFNTITSSAILAYIIADLSRAFITSNEFRSIIKKG